ncbi:MAG: hypothetical protein C0604_09580 [Clostridiales bacterium]|nr:MAG: hypothetical protein C0604_09580 [Clostridiales bacterium]
MKLKDYKFFLYYKKEEEWINAMAAKGYNLIDCLFFRYLFEDGMPGEYGYKIDLVKASPKSLEGRDYLNFLSEMDIEVVDTLFRWVYLRKKVADGPFELYSDYPSIISQHRRIVKMIATVGLANIVVGLGNLSIAASVGTGVNAFISCINLGGGAILALVAYRHYKSLKILEKESQVHE